MSSPENKDLSLVKRTYLLSPKFPTIFTAEYHERRDSIRAHQGISFEESDKDDFPKWLLENSLRVNKEHEFQRY